MTAENYYIERKDYKHNLYGLLGTLFIHGLIFLVLYFYVLYPPDPPLEFQGMQMSLGDENMGGPSLSPIPDPAPAEQYTPISEQTDEPKNLTTEVDESVAITEKKNEKKAEKVIVKPVVKENKQQLDLPKKIEERAIFKKRTGVQGASGYGDGEIPGNEGRPDGSPDGNPDGNGLGNSGFGDGASGPDGVSYVLSGRKVQKLPDIEDNSRSVGKVVVRIVVNREGKVIKAVPGQVGSTSTETNLLEKSKDGALRTKFSARLDGPEEQYGTMTFVYKFKP